MWGEGKEGFKLAEFGGIKWREVWMGGVGEKWDRRGYGVRSGIVFRVGIRGLDFILGY